MTTIVSARARGTSPWAAHLRAAALLPRDPGTGQVAPIIGGLPAVEGSALDIGAPLDERGANPADEQGSGRAGPLTRDNGGGQDDGATA